MLYHLLKSIGKLDEQTVMYLIYRLSLPLSGIRIMNFIENALLHSKRYKLTYVAIVVQMVQIVLTMIQADLTAIIRRISVHVLRCGGHRNQAMMLHQ